MKKSQIVIAFIIVFFSGMLIGVLGGKYYYFIFRGDPPPPPPRDFRVMMDRKITQRLNLTEEQLQKLKPAFEKWSTALMEVNRSTAPQVKKIFFALFDDIEKILVLTPEQKKELAHMREIAVERIDQHGRFKNRNRGKIDLPPEMPGMPGPGPGPGPGPRGHHGPENGPEPQPPNP